MAKTLTAAALVASASNAAGSTTRGRLDCSAADGGMIRWRITNGGTDANIVPLTMFDFVQTPSSSDIQMTGGVFFRAS